MEAPQASKARRPSLMSAPVVSSESDVQSDLVARFLSDSPLAEIAHAALGLTVTLLLIGLYSPWGLAGWLVALCVASYVRYRVRMRFARRPDPIDEIPRPVLATILVVGLVWSAGAMPLLLDADPEVGLRVMIVECGLAAAATFTFAATKTGFRVFLASIFVPLIYGLLANGVDRASITSALLVVVFGATMTALQARGNSQLTRSLQLHLDLDRSRQTAEEGQVALRESERRLFQLLESMPVGVLVVDQQQRIYFSNASAKNIVGDWLSERPSLADARGRASAFVPATNQPLGPDRSPVALALRGERSMEQIEINGPNGMRLVEIHGSPIRNSEGEVTLAVAVLSDLTARQGGDQRRAAINAVLSVAAESESEEQLLANVLQLLTERFSFSLAELWMPTPDGTTLRRVASKQRGTEERVARFDQVSAQLSFARGEGLPGRAWRTGEAIWRNRSAEDDETFRRPGGVVEAGLRTGVAVPVFVAGVASGALVLFTDDRREPDGPVIDTLMAIGAQVGGAITRRRAEATIRAAEERYRHLVEASTDLVWQIDLEGRWTFLNAASERIFGLPPEMMIGRPITEWMSPDHAAQDRTVLARIAAGEIVTEYETVIRNAKGEPVVVSTSGAPVRDGSGGIIGTHGIIRDVGDRAAARAALRAARDAAEQAAAAKSAFLANMSHEIRTPMNGVLGVAELLQGTSLDAEQRRMVDLIATSGNALLDVINEILDFSKIEAHQLEIESAEFELHELVESTVQLVASGARNPDVEVITDVANDVPTHVMGDATRLRQVLSNLVGNALKFTHSGEVIVTVERVAALGRTARLRFRVRDTGIGMTPDTLAAIFEPFRQADSSTTRRYGGTGLGLTISQRLVELMGGALDVSSDEGSGSAFSFELNLPVVATPTVSPEPTNLRDVRVLIVDDSSTNRRVLGGMLAHDGMRTKETPLASEALRWLRDAARERQPFGILVTDVQMPGMDGFELAKAIRSDAAIAETPIVIATSGNRPGDAARASELRISSIISKPLARRDVIRAIQSAVGRAPRMNGDPARRIEPAARVLSVLVAEDNPINQQVAKVMLGKRGHGVDVVDNGRSAVDAALKKAYDVILMDIQMPELDGLQATKEIRRREKGHRSRIVALTANVLPGEREECLESGMDDYLAKPYTAADLFAVLEGGPVPAPAPTSPAEEDEMPIDIDALRSDLRSMGIEGSLEDLVNLFLSDGPSRMATIKAAIASGEARAVASAAHALKSSSGVLRANRLMKALAAMEAAAKTGDFDRAASFGAETDAAYAATEAWLASGAWRQ